MEAQTVTWLVFLALIKHVSTIDPSGPFKLEPGVLLATEGSCVEIKCQVTRNFYDGDANWFWMKDIRWVDKNYTSTVIYSTNTLTRPVSPDFANRVNYIGSPSSSWQNANSARLKPLCSIWICDLRRSDSGKYSLRFEGTGIWKWSSEEVTLNVEDPPTEPKLSMRSEVTEGQTITITCTAESFPQSTLTLMRIDKCHQYLKIPEDNLNSRPINPLYHTFTVTSADAGCYVCRAQNTEGYKDSMWKKLVVKYPPTEPNLSMRSEVTEGQIISVRCTAESFPQSTLTLMRINTNKQSLKITENNLYSRPINSLSHKINVTSSDAGWYFCRAQNTEGSKNSNQTQVVVKYSPNNVTVQADPGLDVKENLSLTLSCSAESNPPVSSVTWRKTTDGREEIIPQTQTQTFRVNSASPSDSGLYSCEATNDIGSGKSQPAEVKVRYSPNNVTVHANPGLDVKENASLTLSCSAESNPPVSSVNWRKTTDGREEIIQQTQTQTFRVNSASPSDSGLYSCEATNNIGSGKSQPAEVKVRFSPKHTHITESAEKQELDGRSSVMLSCFSHSFPPVHNYSWYRKSQGEEKDELVSEHQNHIVYSNQSGVYYCVAQNEVDHSLSDPVHLFERNYLHILMFLLPALFVLMIIISIVVVLRFRRKNIFKQGTTNTKSPSGFSEQLSRPEDQQHQLLPDSTPPTDIDVIYSSLNLSQAASAQNPTRQKAGNTEDYSVHYAPLHFKTNIKKKQRKVEEDSVYAKVSKPMRVKKNEPESLQDNENISDAAARAPTSSNLFDNHTSEGEVELNFPQVRFTATPRRQTTNRDSSSSHQDESLYSNVRNV
ncbi:sialoadhesin isoform X2 [Pleuronectes platessa]|uniref:sialoadhesin isoform X2 n=1 Tax=Pleuronectes platessa TaxID=8262 RepID=UPI00232A19ED|nr:sialoadhesin isoform X2 [Pleuronectes platessa]